MSRPRVVVAGMGDSGLLTAIHLARHVDVVGISTKPGLVSGQELGLRLARPEDWARDYRIGFDRFRRLDEVRTVHGTLTALDLERRAVTVALPDGPRIEEYDALVIATGVTNGFWRRPDLQTSAEVEADLEDAHRRLASVPSIAVVGGGAAAVSSAIQLALRWPEKRVELYHPGERPLPRHHPRVWAHVRDRLQAAGVRVHAGHRAVVPDGFACDQITGDPVEWSTGQPATEVDAVLWAVGRVRPNTAWLPDSLVDDDGFVRVAPTLQSPADPRVFAIGDVAATDPLRSSARNRADRLLARNVRAVLDDGPLHSFQAPRSRWGSVLGPQPDGLQVFAPSGRPFRFPAWTVRRILQPGIVRLGIYGGIRPDRSAPSTSCRSGWSVRR